MLRQYVDQYLGEKQQQDAAAKIEIDGVGADHLAVAVAATEGFSGREISKLVIAWQAAAYGTDGAKFTPTLMTEVLDNHVKQREQKARWQGIE